MSRQMKNFADYFMQGLALGSGWAEKWQAQQIAKERTKLQNQQFQQREAREDKRLGLYAQQVTANAELARARATAALRPKGGGGGGAAAPSADAEALRKEAADRGIISAPAAVPAGGTTYNLIQGSNDGPDPVATEAPVEGPPVGFNRGGMVQKAAGGGSIEQGADMSIEEAMSYGRAKPKGGGFGDAMKSAAGKYKGPADPVRDEAGAVRPVGPQGSGAGGSYTTADVQPGGVLHFDDGGRASALRPRDDIPTADFKVGKHGRAIAGLNYDPNGQVLSSQAGYEHRVGNRGATLGVQGDYSKYVGPGGDQAKPDWQVGVRGRIPFAQGGAVRQYQSGGRVMQAIDTGTSGPGSGYGYRAAPPARRY